MAPLAAGAFIATVHSDDPQDTKSALTGKKLNMVTSSVMALVTTAVTSVNYDLRQKRQKGQKGLS